MQKCTELDISALTWLNVHLYLIYWAKFFFFISFGFCQVQPAVTDRAVQLERKEMDDSFLGSGLFHQMCWRSQIYGTTSSASSFAPNHKHTHTDTMVSEILNSEVDGALVRTWGTVMGAEEGGLALSVPVTSQEILSTLAPLSPTWQDEMW